MYVDFVDPTKVLFLKFYQYTEASIYLVCEN